MGSCSLIRRVNKSQKQSLLANMLNLLFVTVFVTSNNSTFDSINVPCAAIGRYDLHLSIPKRIENCVVDVKVSKFNVHSNWSLLDRIEPSSMRFYNRLHRRQMIVKWDRRYVFIRRWAVTHIQIMPLNYF